MSLHLLKIHSKDSAGYFLMCTCSIDVPVPPRLKKTVQFGTEASCYMSLSCSFWGTASPLHSACRAKKMLDRKQHNATVIVKAAIWGNTGSQLTSLCFIHFNYTTDFGREMSPNPLIRHILYKIKTVLLGGGLYIVT